MRFSKSQYLILIFFILGTIYAPTSATTFDSEQPVTNAIPSLQILLSHEEWDTDNNGAVDTVEIDIRIDYANMNFEMLNIYVSVYNSNGLPILLKTDLISSDQHGGSNYFYEYFSYRSSFSGNVSFEIWGDINGTIMDSSSFFVDYITEYSTPWLVFNYVNFEQYDHDGDLFDDAIRVQYGLNSINISSNAQSTLEVYKYNFTILSYEYVRELSHSLYLDQIQPVVDQEYNYYISETGDYKFHLRIEYDDILLNDTYEWFGAYEDARLPLRYDTQVILYDQDGAIGMDSFDILTTLNFTDYFGTVDVNAYVSDSETGIQWDDWNFRISPEGSSYEVVRFSGAYPWHSNYTFRLEISDDFGRVYQESFYRENQSAFQGSYLSIDLRLEPISWDQGSIDLNAKVHYVNVDGQYPVQIDIYWYDGFNWNLIESRFDQQFYAYTLGNDDVWYTFKAPMSGDYRFDVSILANGFTAFKQIYWFNVNVTKTNFDFWYGAWDQDNNGSEDTVYVEGWINYDFDIMTFVEVIMIVEKYDPVSNQYFYFEERRETRYLDGSGDEWFHLEFSPYENGDFHFIVDMYVDGEYQLGSSISFDYYLELNNNQGQFFDWYLDVDEYDLDDDGLADHLNLRVSLNFDNLPPTVVEVIIYSDRNPGTTEFSDSIHLEGSGSNELGFEYQAQEDGDHDFLIEIYVNGELRDEISYSWFGHKYDENNIGKSNSDDNVNDESSVAPELPVPAGSLYLYVISLLGLGLIIKKRKY